VEKEYNFYSSTPLKNQLFTGQKSQNTFNGLLSTNFIDNSGEATNYNITDNTHSSFFRSEKKKIEDGEVKNSFLTSNFHNYPTSLKSL